MHTSSITLTVGGVTRPKRQDLATRAAIARLGKKKSSGVDKAKAESEAAKEKLGTKYVVREGNQFVGITEDTSPQGSAAPRVSFDQGERSKSKDVTARASTNVPVSSGVGKGGVQQVPGLQTQIAPMASQEPAARPVASGVRGDVLYADRQGTVYRPVASSVEGGTILGEERTKVKTSELVLPSTGKAEGFIGVGFISTERRKDIVKFGESLLEGNEVGTPDRFGNPRTQFAVNARKILGSNLVDFGYNPQQYTLKNVVLPAQAGALTVAAVEASAVTKFAPAIAEIAGASPKVTGLLGKGSEAALVGLGGYQIVGELERRTPEQQRPDIVFGIAGGLEAGRAPRDFFAGGKKEVELYGGGVGGGRSNRASRLGLRTADKPTSRIELRKQSYQQNYNPNLYRNAGEFGAKLGKEREFIRFAQKGTVEVGTRRPATELGVQGQSVEKGIRITKGNPAVLESFNNYGFTSSGKADYLPTSPGQGKANKYANRDLSSLGYQDTVVALQQSKQSGALKALEVFGGAKRTPTTPGQKFVNNPEFNLQTVPQYELTPGAKAPKSIYEPTALSGVRGGFRVRSSGERVVKFGTGRFSKSEQSFEVGVPFDNQLVPVTPRPPVLLQDTSFSVVAKESITKGSVVKLVVPDTSFSTEPKSVLTPKGVSVPDFNLDKFNSRSLVSGSVPAVLFNNKQDQDNKQKQSSFLVLKSDLVNAQKNDLFSGNVIVSKPLTTTFADTGLRSDVGLNLGQEQDYVSKTKTEQVPKQEFNFPNPTPSDFTSKNPNIVNLPPVPPPIKVFEGLKNPQKDVYDRLFETPKLPKPFVFVPDGNVNKGGDFLVQVGKPGNKYYYNLGVGGKDLIERGARLAKGTAAASVRVVPLNASSKVDVAALLGGSFKLGKTGAYVQTTKTRISSSGEKQQIPGEAKRQRITKGTTYGKALAFQKQGVPLRAIRGLL